MWRLVPQMKEKEQKGEEKGEIKYVSARCR
jgi:hypothetical protein